MLKKISSFFTEKDSLFYTSSTPAALIACLVVLSTSFIFPDRQSHNQKIENKIKEKHEAMESFSKTINQTINYFRTHNEYACKSQAETDQDRKKFLIQKSDEFYNKVLSIDPSYEVSCTILQFYFDPEAGSEALALRKLIDSHLAIDFSCTSNCKFEASEKLIMDKYEELIIKMVEQLRPE